MSRLCYLLVVAPVLLAAFVNAADQRLTGKEEGESQEGGEPKSRFLCSRAKGSEKSTSPDGSDLYYNTFADCGARPGMIESEDGDNLAVFEFGAHINANKQNGGKEAEGVKYSMTLKYTCLKPKEYSPQREVLKYTLDSGKQGGTFASGEFDFAGSAQDLEHNWGMGFPFASWDEREKYRNEIDKMRLYAEDLIIDCLGLPLDFELRYNERFNIELNVLSRVEQLMKAEGVEPEVVRYNRPPIEGAEQQSPQRPEGAKKQQQNVNREHGNTTPPNAGGVQQSPQLQQGPARDASGGSSGASSGAGGVLFPVDTEDDEVRPWVKHQRPQVRPTPGSTASPSGGGAFFFPQDTESERKKPWDNGYYQPLVSSTTPKFTTPKFTTSRPTPHRPIPHRPIAPTSTTSRPVPRRPTPRRPAPRRPAASPSGGGAIIFPQ